MEKTNPTPVPPTNDRPNRLPWPPIIYAVVLVAAYLLEQIAPLAGMPHERAWRSAGWVLFTVAIAVGVAGIAHFRSVGTPVDPTGQARKLATRGIYQYTRNPMYLGAVAGFAGLSFALGSAWLLILSLLMPFALRKFAIDGEEAYLRRRFGADYERYCNSVRRWV